MVEVICDKCKQNCDLNAYAVSVEVIHNPNPHNPLVRGGVKLTDDNSFMRMVLCQKCFDEMGMPNIYKVQRTGKLEFESEVAGVLRNAIDKFEGGGKS